MTSLSWTINRRIHCLRHEIHCFVDTHFILSLPCKSRGNFLYQFPVPNEVSFRMREDWVSGWLGVDNAIGQKMTPNFILFRKKVGGPDGYVLLPFASLKPFTDSPKNHLSKIYPSIFTQDILRACYPNVWHGNRHQRQEGSSNGMVKEPLFLYMCHGLITF